MQKLRKIHLYIFLYPFLLGSCCVLGFAPFNFTLINFLIFPLLLTILFNIREKDLKSYNFFYIGISFGFGFFLAGNYWISISLTHDDSFKYLIPFSIFLVPLFLSIFFGLTFFISGFFVEKSFSFVLFFSLIFSILEFIRGNILTGFPWNLIAYTWSWSIESIQILSIIGTYSLSLISVTFFCFPYIFLKKNNYKKNVFFLITFFVIFLGNYVYGLSVINESNHKFNKNHLLKIVSPNFSLKDFTGIKNEFNNLKKLIALSDPDKSKKTIFIWPEGIFSENYLDNITKYKNLFYKSFNENHLIVLGINSRQKNKYFNSMVVLDHNLQVLHKYDKINLVPFGEFLPFEKIFLKYGLKKITRGYNSFSSGNVRNIINLKDKFKENSILPLICYEIIYSGKIKTENQSPDIVINISEDAWFGKSIGPYQHFSKVIYRSIEEGLFIIRAANRGVSALVDPNGRILKSLDIQETGIIEHNFPRFNKNTLFSKYGNKIFLLIIFLYIFLILILRKFKI